MIKIGFIGVGSMGKNHLRVALELSHCFQVVGFYDSSLERQKEIFNTYGVKLFNSAEELMDAVDAIVIATPASSHYELGLLAAKKKKHILMEKPVCLNVEEAKDLQNKCKGLICLVSHVERYNPSVSQLSSILKNEEVVAIEIHRCSPYDKRIFDADVIEDLMIHDIDILINELWPYKIDNIVAYGNSMFSKDNLDYVNAIMRFEDNVICSIVSSRSTQNKIRMINVHTKTGYISANMLERNVTITRRTSYTMSDSQQYKQDSIVETVMLPIVEPLKEEYYSFYNCIINKDIPKTNLVSSIKTLELCKKIQDICIKD